MFDRFDICLAYYWYACEAYSRYEEQCEILSRLKTIGFSPGHGAECSEWVKEDYVFQNALHIYEDLVESGGYVMRGER